MAKDKRFDKVHSDGAMSGCEIWVDTQTGVQYFFRTREQVEEILAGRVKLRLGEKQRVLLQLLLEGERSAEAVREELRAGKTIDGAIRSGSKNSFWAIFDGNITVLIVSVVLMGVFGSSDSIFGFLFSWLPMSTTGSVYSFGYTLLIGVVTNFVMGVWASRVMLRSISRLKIFRNPWFYGGDRV